MGSNKSKNKVSSDKEILYTYTPNFLIIVGVMFNILFASIFSVLLVTVVITIPTIVFNALLFVPRVNVKRYWAAWRIIPISLSFSLALLTFLLAIFATDGILDIYDGINNFLVKIFFWMPSDSRVLPLVSRDLQPTITKLIKAIFILMASIGNVFVLFGWYHAKEIGIIEKKISKVEKEKKLTETKRNRKEKSIMKKEEKIEIRRLKEEYRESIQEWKREKKLNKSSDSFNIPKPKKPWKSKDFKILKNEKRKEKKERKQQKSDVDHKIINHNQFFDEVESFRKNPSASEKDFEVKNSKNFQNRNSSTVQKNSNNNFPILTVNSQQKKSKKNGSSSGSIIDYNQFFDEVESSRKNKGEK